MSMGDRGEGRVGYFSGHRQGPSVGIALAWPKVEEGG